MKNYVQPGGTITLTAPYAVVSGDGLKVGLIVGFAQYAAAIGTEVETLVEGVVTHAKAANALTQGQAVYWDDAARLVTGTVGANTKIGVAMLAALSGDVSATVRLNGSF